MQMLVKDPARPVPERCRAGPGGGPGAIRGRPGPPDRSPAGGDQGRADGRLGPHRRPATRHRARPTTPRPRSATGNARPPRRTGRSTRVQPVVPAPAPQYRPAAAAGRPGYSQGTATAHRSPPPGVPAAMPPASGIARSSGPYGSGQQSPGRSVGRPANGAVRADSGGRTAARRPGAAGHRPAGRRPGGSGSTVIDTGPDPAAAARDGSDVISITPSNSIGCHWQATRHRRLTSSSEACCVRDAGNGRIGRISRAAGTMGCGGDGRAGSALSNGRVADVGRQHR